MFLAASSLSALGCAVSTDANDGNETAVESTKASSEALSVYQWSSDYKAGNSSSAASAAVVAATWQGHDEGVMVHTGDDDGDKEMYWAVSGDGRTWDNDQKIPNMTTSSPARLALFNNKIYMVHTGENDCSVWMSRIDTTVAPWTWAHDFEIPYTSCSSPALAAYNGSLYLVGERFNGQLWQATMSTSEVFSAAADIPGAISASGSPGITTYCASAFCYPGTLFIAYETPSSKVGMTGLQMTFGRRGATGSWWTPWLVTNTDGTVKRTSVSPALASYGGAMHLVDTDPATGDLIKWSYYDGSNWSPDVSIYNQEMADFASLASFPDQLVMVHPSSVADHQEGLPITHTEVYAEYFQ